MAKKQPAQRGIKRRGSYKPKAMCEQAAKMSISGKSNREIARKLKVKPHTVPGMLEKSETLAEYRKQLARRIPKALQNVDVLLDGKMDAGPMSENIRARGTMWLLEACQVAIRKEEHNVSMSPDPYATRSPEDKQFFLDHGGVWPEEFDSGNTGTKSSRA
jgi:hypothetical protein